MSKDRRIILAAYSLSNRGDGISHVARLLAEVLREEVAMRRVAVSGLTLARDSLPGEVGFPVICAKGSKLKMVLAAHRAALEHTHFIFDSCNIAQICPRLLGFRRPVLTFIHGIEVWENAKPRWIRAAQRSTRLVSNTCYTRDRADQIHGGFARAIPCHLSTEPEVPPLVVDWGRRKIGRPEALIVGRMDASHNYKGHRELIECWPQVVAAIPGAILNIVGRGSDLENLRDLAERSQAKNEIRFHGFLPEMEINELLAKARIFVMPSRGEGFGLVYIEAMRHGLPIIASVHDAAQEIVVDGENGFLVNLNRPYELPLKVVQLMQDLDLAERMGCHNQRQWTKKYTFSAFKRRFLPILREFLEC